MIDSYYWKRHLLNAARKLELRARQRAWSARSIDLLERELMIAFFCIRKLIEAKKLTDACERQKIVVRRFRNRGGRSDLMSLVEFEKVYELSSGDKKELTIGFLANQLIHSYFIFPAFSRRNRLNGIWVTSDFERYKALYHIPTSSLISAIRHVGRDQIRKLTWKHGRYDGEWEIDVKS